MSIAEDHVSYFRDQWALRLVDSCVVSRVTGTTFNDTTGETEETTETAYSGECLVRPANASETDFGEDRRQEVDYDLFLPYDADIAVIGDSDDLEEGDSVVVTSDLDPDIPTLTVLRGFQDSYLTKRHYETKVVTDV